jgi:hypothetical protein
MSHRRRQPSLGITILVGDPVRNGFGRVGRAPAPTEKRYSVFDLRAARATVPVTENPRVGGSIPALATIPPKVHSSWISRWAVRFGVL